MRQFDVIIIGGGVVGSAIARELSRYRLSIAVMEKNPDVVCETSGRNSGVVHGGFAYDEGTLKARLCVEGNRGMDALAGELGFRFLRCGKVLVGRTQEEYESLQRTMAQGARNGATGLSLIDKDELARICPAAVGEFAMLSKTSGVLDPFGYTIAIAENAAQNGVRYFLGHTVTGLARGEEAWQVETDRGAFAARWVVNAAGLGCGEISQMLGFAPYRVIGSKGDYIILDKHTGELLPMPIYPVPSNTYMGIHVTNTTDGNVIVGPNAEWIDDHARFSDYGVTQENIDYLAQSASEIWPHIHRKDYIRNYAGILPKWVDENGKIQDFKIEMNPKIAPNAVNLVGIESPGLTAAVPIGRYVAAMMRGAEAFEENPAFDPVRRPIARFADMDDAERAAQIEKNPDYGEIVCRCEQVTRAEILQAIHNPLGVRTLTGIKLRTRSMMGRCQGGYCQMRVARMIEEELGVPPGEMTYGRAGSWLFSGVLGEKGGEA